MNGTPVEPEIEEYKWVILPNKYTIYNEEGTTLKTENKTLNEWEPPISGDYVIQLHATGGEGEENKAEGDTSNLGPAIIIRRKLE